MILIYFYHKYDNNGHNHIEKQFSSCFHSKSKEPLKIMERGSTYTDLCYTLVVPSKYKWRQVNENFA